MPGAGGLPMMAYTGRLRPKGFRLQEPGKQTASSAKNVDTDTVTWRAASPSDRNMGENLSPIWPGNHCLNSAKHRPLTAWNHTWAEIPISFRELLWSFIRHIFQRIILADTTRIIKLIRRTQLKKRTWWIKNHSETVHHSENLWRCRGVLHKLSNRWHLRINIHLFPANEGSAAI